jgi:hypothetical protein
MYTNNSEDIFRNLAAKLKNLPQFDRDGFHHIKKELWLDLEPRTDLVGRGADTPGLKALATAIETWVTQALTADDKDSGVPSPKVIVDVVGGDQLKVCVEFDAF